MDFPYSLKWLLRLSLNFVITFHARGSIIFVSIRFSVVLRKSKLFFRNILSVNRILIRVSFFVIRVTKKLFCEWAIPNDDYWSWSYYSPREGTTRDHLESVMAASLKRPYRKKQTRLPGAGAWINGFSMGFVMVWSKSSGLRSLL